jgi:PadR family transcriptional regulator, regulatory protein PadR
MNVQFKKGVLEMCVLALLNKQDRYGYELVQLLSEHMEIGEGTVYPLLRRLANEEYFSTYLQESAEGPPRKYYKLSVKGRAYLEAMLLDWSQFSSAVEQILKEGNRNE